MKCYEFHASWVNLLTYILIRTPHERLTAAWSGVQQTIIDNVVDQYSVVRTIFSINFINAKKASWPLTMNKSRFALLCESEQSSL